MEILVEMILKGEKMTRLAIKLLPLLWRILWGRVSNWIQRTWKTYSTMSWIQKVPKRNPWKMTKLRSKRKLTCRIWQFPIPSNS